MFCQYDELLSDTIGDNKPLVSEGSMQATASAANSLFYTGLAVTVPANKAYTIYAHGDYNQARVSDVVVSTSSNPSQDWFFISGSNNGFSTCAVGSTGTAPVTLYVLAKFAGTGVNRVLYKLITQNI